MKIGDLVKIKSIRKPPRIGFITEIGTNEDGRMLCYVRFPKTGMANWHDLSRVEVISEAG